ncbi:MAG: FG-GAP-like repeat-containing protein [Acidobacteriota bacterium]|nr:FG-GAP-like repeat-containing protein [Acidobacteriota bacterium]
MFSGRPRAHLGIVLLLGTCLFGCSADPTPSLGPVVFPAEEGTPDNSAMVELLEAVAVQGDIDNPFLGQMAAPRLRELLATAPTEGYVTERRQVRRQLARHELRLGNELEAIEHLQKALELARGTDDELEIRFEFGVAWMRRAESLNCRQHHTSESCIFPIKGGGLHVDPAASRHAADAFRGVIALSQPGDWFHTKARWLLAIAAMTLNEYPESMSPELRIPAEALESDASFPRFEEIARSLGVDTVDLAGGNLVDDFTGDGFLDLVTSTSDTYGGMHFWVNDGNGAFVGATEAAGLTGLLGGLNMTHADYDNDGDLDIFVLRGGWWREPGAHPNSLLRNEGDGRFLDVTQRAGLLDVSYPTQTAAWGDFDLDGDLDLYVGNETNQRYSAPSQLFRNEGDGTFIDVAAAAGVTNDRYAKSVSWGDYNNDRAPDLYVSNISGANRLYRNLGDGTFEDVAVELGVDKPISSFPAWFFDVNNDGNLDLFVSAYGGKRDGPEMGFVAAEYMGLQHRGEKQRLFLGDGGTFSDVTEAYGLYRTTLPMGHNFGDLDNDGWLDFYLGTGYPYYEGLTPNVMYRNVGGVRFDDVTFAGGFGNLQKGHGVSFVDFDHDGDQDVFEQMGGAYPGDAYGNAVYENPGFGNNWVKIELRGVQSNRHGLGARLRVVVQDAGVERSIYRTVGTGATFGGNPTRQEIGVGAAEAIERLEVFWPVTGETQTFLDLPVNALVRLSETKDGMTVIPLAGSDQHGLKSRR